MEQQTRPPWILLEREIWEFWGQAVELEGKANLHIYRSTNTIHPSIFYTRLIRQSGRGGAGAYPSGHRARGGVHPGQVASPSQGPTETNEINNHTRSHEENIQTPHRKAPAGSWTWNPLAVKRRCSTNVKLYPSNCKLLNDHFHWKIFKYIIQWTICLNSFNECLEKSFFLFSYAAKMSLRNFGRTKPWRHNESDCSNLPIAFIWAFVRGGCGCSWR